ncbi:ureidoglycolate hydrolase [Starkeya sp. ORNL1]|uniref:ureidoglycolate lyase n=1 Tax=Starkeya sp. ORNL1 TaxID=2709380 RepID=UPI0014629DE2|nr:ureidoglycolate lyase [Starkeya sp. ORNL1]QJP14098.1 ureidoglycolate hydrolase [Starkeya sp. ORNL1]
MTENFTWAAAPTLELQPIDGEQFRPFGHVLRAADPNAQRVNAGTALRHDVAAFAPDSRPGSRLVASMFEARPQSLPLAVDLVERHPFSEQTIISMRGGAFALAVCLAGPDGGPDLASLRAFRVPAGGGIIYRKGVWHTPIIALSGESLFFVQSSQDGTADDCHEVTVSGLLIA